MIPIGDGAFSVEPMTDAGELICVTVYAGDRIMGSVYGYHDDGNEFSAEMFRRWLADWSATPREPVIAGTRELIEQMWAFNPEAAAVLFALGRSWDYPHEVN